MAEPLSDRTERICRVIARVPRGKVATYGQVAALAGIPNGARQVGYALHAVSERKGLPWQRIVNARGEISLRNHSHMDRVQRKLLESEGVEFDARGRIALARYQWRPRNRRN